MGKRLRSLQSVLWESDEEDGARLHEAWSSQARPTCACRMSLAAERHRCSQLEQDIQTLKLVIKDLQQKMRDPLPAVPKLVVKNPAATSALRNGNPWYWLARLHHATGDLPRLQQEIIPDLQNTGFANSRITFDVCEWKLASDLLDACTVTIHSLYSKHPAVFKVGITRNPVIRWSTGYAKDTSIQWTEMKVLALLPDPLSAGLVEASLIHRFEGCPGNQNIRKGGEGVDLSGEGPYFVYVVFRCLVPPHKKK